MKNSVLKPILGGALFGTFVFFTGPLIFIILVLKFIFTPFGMGRMHHRRLAFAGPGFADKIRSMSEEDYANFKTKMESRYRGNCSRRNETENA
jgi:hypothetical protein